MPVGWTMFLSICSENTVNESFFVVQQNRESWQMVFFIAAAVYSLGAAVYIVLGSGDIQSWAVSKVPPSEELVLADAQRPFDAPKSSKTSSKPA